MVVRKHDGSRLQGRHSWETEVSYPWPSFAWVTFQASRNGRCACVRVERIMSFRTITHLVCSVALCFAAATTGSADALHAGGSWQTWTAGAPGSTLGTVSAPTYDGGPTTTTNG